MHAIDPDLARIVESLNESGLMDWSGLDAEGVRAKFSDIKQTVREPAVALVQDVDVPGAGGPIACRLYHPQPGTRLPGLVWCHGGGWVLGTLDGEEATARFLATAGQMAVLSVDYRLAPEHRFPAAFEDAMAAFDWTCANASELELSCVAMGGASAGGNLAAAVGLERAGPPGPEALLLVYPILDSDLDRPSMHTFGEDLVLHRDHMAWFWDQYVPDERDRAHPRAAVLQAAIPQSLAPVTLLLAECDPLVDEGLEWARQLQRSGVDLQLVVAKGLTHGYLGMSRRVPAARALLEAEIRRFVSHLNAHA
ncbi:MAG: alpha/beta hydrolase [Phycisphaerales bacterium]|nr:alpha/beta hydrolase [Phycisphaerales bacterium]